MSRPDLDSVLARKAMISRERVELEKLRADLDSEETELDVAERVLKRLADNPPTRSRRESLAVDAAPVPAMGDPAQPIREG